MRYNVYRMCENPQVWEFMRRFWELFTMFRFLHDIYQFIGVIIYSIALLVNEQFDIGRKNKKNVLLWKKSLMKACKAEINILSLQSLSWIQSFYLKETNTYWDWMPIAVKRRAFLFLVTFWFCNFVYSIL